MVNLGHWFHSPHLVLFISNHVTAVASSSKSLRDWVQNTWESVSPDRLHVHLQNHLRLLDKAVLGKSSSHAVYLSSLFVRTFVSALVEAPYYRGSRISLQQDLELQVRGGCQAFLCWVTSRTHQAPGYRVGNPLGLAVAVVKSVKCPLVHPVI